MLHSLKCFHFSVQEMILSGVLKLFLLLTAAKKTFFQMSVLTRDSSSQFVKHFGERDNFGTTGEQ